MTWANCSSNTGKTQVLICYSSRKQFLSKKRKTLSLDRLIELNEFSDYVINDRWHVKDKLVMRACVKNFKQVLTEE
jgi:hypothetical protein